ncbi:MAG: prepilin-type N-terminal cleavage/methylation domain-containing protein [Planctomycetaceae bacterium]|nr:prepilin-type N-terminal cleavage/methylation domain-containing protein [Planctomycetaceae bacterium]
MQTQPISNSRLRQRPHPSPHHPRRGGFSLIELVVVILVIAIIASFAIPAVQRAITTARVAGVTVEIRDLEKGIADFKLRYGVEPPSLFRIREDSTTWSTSNNVDRNSISMMRRMWPTFNAGGVDVDVNGDGDTSDTITLQGAECLAFFLGGNGVLSGTPTGFSKNPINPFATGGERVGPFAELDVGRLVDVDGDGNPEYMDNLPGQTMPYQYFSSYDGRGYQLGGFDNDLSTAADNEVLTISGTLSMAAPYFAVDAAWPDDAGMSTVSADMAPALGQYFKPNGFQIISPGFDALYGIGGLYRDGEGIPIWIAATDSFRSRAARTAEADNITNFTGGMLSPSNSFQEYRWDRE